MACSEIRSGWFCDRLAIASHLPDNAVLAGDGLVDAINSTPDLRVDYAPVGRRGRNQGLSGTWQRELHLNGAKGSPGRIFVRCTEVGTGPEATGSVYVEWNPMAATVDATVSIGAMLRDLGCDVLAATVHRFDATIDLPGRADEFVIDDRLRKCMVINNDHRETMEVGRSGPLRAMLYDKRRQMLEVHGVEIGRDVTRYEVTVRPSKSVLGVCGDERVRVPEDRSLAALASWPFPAPRTVLRRVDPERCTDFAMAGWLHAAQSSGVRAALATMRRRFRFSARERDFVNCMPRVDVESCWSSSWSASAGLLVAALQGECFGASCERVAA